MPVTLATHLRNAFIEGIRFNTNSKLDLRAAEEACSMDYPSFNALRDRCRGLIPSPRLLRDFDKYTGEFRKTHDL